MKRFPLLANVSLQANDHWATMMKSDLKLIPYAPVRPSVKLATRTQHGVRLGYAAAVAMAFLFSGLALAVLMALIWHETSLSPGVFVVTSRAAQC